MIKKEQVVKHLLMKHKRNIENKKCQLTDAENGYYWLSALAKFQINKMSHIQMKHKYNREASEAQQ